MVKWMLLGVVLVAGSAVAESLDDVPLYRLYDGGSEGFKLRGETRYVAFYYSASWCGPCRRSTPPLVEEYGRMQRMEEMPVEVVLVGADETEAEMFSYMERYGMEWPAVVFSKAGMVDKYAARGVPSLVLVERASGRVVSHGVGPGGVEEVVARMREITEVKAERPFEVGGWSSRYGVLIAVGLSILAIFFYQKWRGKR